MRAFIGRIVAVVVGAIAVWLAGTFGVEVTDDARVALTDGLTGVGMFIWLLVYPIVHRLIDRRINPADVAKPASAVEPLGFRGVPGHPTKD